MVNSALASGVSVRGYISVVLGCPIEGDVKPQQVSYVAKALFEMGCYEISLGDTLGTGTPLETARLIELVGNDVPLEKIAGHYHDTYGQALANILISLELGVSKFDCSVAGLGGCPFAGPGASGNVATEDVLYMLNGMGVQTDINIEKVVAVSNFICKKLGRPNTSKAGQALQKRRTDSLKSID